MRTTHDFFHGNHTRASARRPVSRAPWVQQPFSPRVTRDDTLGPLLPSLHFLGSAMELWRGYGLAFGLLRSALCSGATVGRTAAHPPDIGWKSEWLGGLAGSTLLPSQYGYDRHKSQFGQELRGPANGINVFFPYPEELPQLLDKSVVFGSGRGTL